MKTMIKKNKIIETGKLDPIQFIFEVRPFDYLILAALGQFWSFKIMILLGSHKRFPAVFSLVPEMDLSFSIGFKFLRIR